MLLARFRAVDVGSPVSRTSQMGEPRATSGTSDDLGFVAVLERATRRYCANYFRATTFASVAPNPSEVEGDAPSLLTMSAAIGITIR